MTTRPSSCSRSNDARSVAVSGLLETWVALLRAINLGSRNRVPMAELRRVLADAGCDSVETYIQSGNVVFTAPRVERADLARRLGRAVEAAFAVDTLVILRTASEIARISHSHPFGPDTSRSYVTFLAEPPAPEAVEKLQGADAAPDAFRVDGCDVYIHYPAGIQGALLPPAKVERLLGVHGTNRNWRTVERLAKLAGRR
jgi:uncharacterized protein (DUF1697 family)